MIRYAVMGTGAAAQAFSRDAAQCRELCAETGRPAAQGVEAEAVYLSGADGSPFFSAALMLGGGKHVLCESFARLTPRELDTLAALAEKHRVSLAEYRSPSLSPGFAALCGHLPRLGAVHSVRLQDCSPDLGRALIPRSAGCLALLDGLTGLPEPLEAQLLRCPDGRPAALSIMARSRNLEAEILCSSLSGSRVTNRVQGSLGEIRFQGIDNPHNLVFVGRDGIREQLAELPPRRDGRNHSAGAEQAFGESDSSRLARWLRLVSGAEDWRAPLGRARLVLAALETVKRQLQPLEPQKQALPSTCGGHSACRVSARRISGWQVSG